MKIYAIRNRLISSYQMFTSNLEPEVQKTELTRFCMLEKEKAKAYHYDESELYLLGEFDENSAAFKIEKQPVHIVDLGQFFPKMN